MLPFEKVVPRLVEKAYQQGDRVQIICDNHERMETLNHALWTFAQAAFIPHSYVGDPKDNPVWLTLSTDLQNNPSILFLIGLKTYPEFAGIKRLIDIYDGNDEQTGKSALERIERYRGRNIIAKNWVQNLKGSWSEA